MDKQMKVARGTARDKRRTAAREIATSAGVPGKYFAEFWRNGATWEAAEEVTKAARARDERAAALARAAEAVKAAQVIIVKIDAEAAA